MLPFNCYLIYWRSFHYKAVIMKLISNNDYFRSLSQSTMASSPSSTSGYLHNLCRQGNTSAIRPYLQGISDINKLEERVGFLGYTPLHEATNRGQTSVVRLLLLYGANANAKANGFYTPLHIAASMDNLDCVMELLKHNADITSKDEFGKTPYDTAMIHRCKKTARILKSEGQKLKCKRQFTTGYFDGAQQIH